MAAAAHSAASAPLAPIRKIYFCGSIRGQEADKARMRQLIGHLQRHGKVLTEHIGLDVPEPRAMTDAEIYERDVAWLRESDLVVAEVTAASLGVGYELALAEALGKKHILCLYNNPARPLSAMIAGCPRFLVKDYATLEEALKAIDKFMEEARL